MRRLPLVVTALCAVAIAIALLIPPTPYSERVITALFSTFAAAYALIGGLISARRPDHPVGWLMLAVGVTLTLPVLLGAYAGYALLADPRWPLGRAAAWVTTWTYLVAFCGIALLILKFPAGRLVDPVRTWTARVLVVAGTVLTVALALAPGPMDGFGTVPNPVGLESLSGVLPMVFIVSGAAVVAAFLIALGSIIVRLRRASGAERQQLKWFVYGAGMIVVAQIPNALPLGLEDSLLGLIGVVLSLVALPLAIAVAVMQHRLYDIDLVIKRTLVYGSLTVLLAVTYLGLVLGLRVLVNPLTGESDLAVAVSTLVVAALFRPLRSRIQSVVDRRFFRSRYDAAHTVASFTGRLRQGVDLTAVSHDLCLVVRETMQPAHVSLWMRQAELDRGTDRDRSRAQRAS